MDDAASAARVPAPEPVCPACDGAPLALLVASPRMEALGRQARAFHAVRLDSRRRAELEERASFTQQDDVDLLACGVCALLVRWPRPGADELLRTYVADRYPEDRLVEMVAAQASLHRRQVPTLRRLLEGHARQVVEVGSFVGGFLEVARTARWPAIGIDPNPQLVESCRARELDARVGTLEELAGDLPRAATDVVAIWNTFDQLVDPEPVLAASARLLRPGGILALRVPHGVAFRALHERLARARGVRRRMLEACLAWNNLLSFPYLHGYGIASLDRIVPRFGFRRVSVRGDVLGSLSGRATRGFARAEERAIKRFQALWIARQARDPHSALPAAPWLDVYYRREDR